MCMYVNYLLFDCALIRTKASKKEFVDWNALNSYSNSYACRTSSGARPDGCWAMCLKKKQAIHFKNTTRRNEIKLLMQGIRKSLQPSFTSNLSPPNTLPQLHLIKQAPCGIMCYPRLIGLAECRAAAYGHGSRAAMSRSKWRMRSSMFCLVLFVRASGQVWVFVSWSLLCWRWTVQPQRKGRQSRPPQ